MTCRGNAVPSRKPIEQEFCPVARSVDLIGDRWSLLIVRNAFDGMRRFGDFQRDLGVARNILADRLRKLVDAGILAMQGASDGTSYQEYVLTDKGESLFPIVVALRQWGEQHLFERGERHSLLIDRRTGKPVPLMAPAAQDGTALKAQDTDVQKVT
ncbi:HxlR family transcriptional regulator [Enterobacter ludwigii]|nr:MULTISPECIES: helix-turn-helix domain-containing protein [Enterobacter cloacae complex]AOT44053.1 HxlR family transcriptional regulator [Enterobacter ludwigii]